METYQEFLNRINSFQKSKLEFYCDHFKPSLSVESKVNKDNSFKNFYGDAVVFDLDSEIKNKITNIIDMLYDKVPECFCEKIISDTIHMTLHDLSNSPTLSDVSQDIFNNEINLINKLTTVKIKHKSIRMKTKFIFNMVNTSLVLGLYPVNEDEYIKLIDLYGLVDEIKELPYPFTPHITLAYYNSFGFSVESKRKLEAVVNSLNKETFLIELDTDNLYYQKFTNMNNYINIFKIIP